MTKSIETLKANRKSLLETTDWIVLRHIEQLKLISYSRLTETTITESQYADLLEYRQKLRDSINQNIDPEIIEIPIWLGDLLYT